MADVCRRTRPSALGRRKTHTRHRPLCEFFLSAMRKRSAVYRYEARESIRHVKTNPWSWAPLKGKGLFSNMKRLIIAVLLVVRNPVAIWAVGGRHAALWAAQSGWSALTRGAVHAVDTACEDAVRGAEVQNCA